MKVKLERDFTSNEVKRALKQISALKSPGPDDFEAGFYKNYWDIFGNETSKVVMEFLKEGKI